jgi:DNA-binding GntR family transcriptional regulator
MVKRKADGVERIYDRVKKRAMEFSFAPGQKIKEGELATEFGTSRIPVREALNRLVSEGFMTFVPNRGFFCRDIDVNNILALYQVRAALEMWAFRRACQSAPAEDIAAFCDLWANQMTPDDFDSLNHYDAEFHLSMARLSGNALLQDQIGQISDKIFAFRNLELQDTQRRAQTFGEHEKILRALRGRQAELGALLLEDHILNSAGSAIASARVRFGLTA